MKIAIFNQTESGIGASVLLGYKLLNLIKGGANVSLMSENLKIASALKRKGVTVLKDLKRLEFYLSTTDSTQKLLVIDSIDMFRDKELRAVVRLISSNDNSAFDDTTVVFVCKDTKQGKKKTEVLKIALSGVSYTTYTVVRDKDAVCILDNSDECIKDVTEIAKYGYPKVMK